MQLEVRDVRDVRYPKLIDIELGSLWLRAGKLLPRRLDQELLTRTDQTKTGLPELASGESAINMRHGEITMRLPAPPGAELDNITSIKR